MSRVDKFSRKHRRDQHHTVDQQLQQEKEIEGESSETLPARSKKYPSTKDKLTRLYYNLLFVLFVALVMFLLWYGHNYTSEH